MSDSRPLVLITGSSGLIGSRLVRLLASDYRVVGLDVVEPEDPPPGVEHEAIDLTDEQDIVRALHSVRERCGEEVASIVHLAAYYDFAGDSSPLYDELTVQGSRRLLRWARKVFARVDQIVFSSTSIVLEPSEDGRVLREDSPRGTRWPYPESKIRAEDALAAVRGEAKLAVLRLAGAYDEWGHSPLLAPNLWRIAHRELESWVFPGDSSAIQHYLHLDDAVAALRAAVERREDLDEHEVFLIAEPEGVTYAELQDAIGRALWGASWRPMEMPESVARLGAELQEGLGAGDPFVKPFMIAIADDSYPMSVERARRRLGWEAKHALLELIPEMVCNLREHPDRFYEINDLPGELPEEAQRQAS